MHIISSSKSHKLEQKFKIIFRKYISYLCRCEWSIMKPSLNEKVLRIVFDLFIIYYSSYLYCWTKCKSFCQLLLIRSFSLADRFSIWVNSEISLLFNLDFMRILSTHFYNSSSICIGNILFPSKFHFFN